MPAAPAIDLAATRARILQQARAHFFAHGYCRCTMDELASELGMSKKTLYVHFAGKDELIAAVIDDVAAEVRADAEALLGNRQLNFAEKLRGFVEGMAQRLAALNPATMRDLQRFAPHLHAKLEAARQQNIPYIFGRFVEEGQMTGLVRDTVSSAFAVEFYLHAMQGLLHPAALERSRRSPREIIQSAVDLFFGGLLTPAGRKQYEKLFSR